LSQQDSNLFFAGGPLTHFHRLCGSESFAIKHGTAYLETLKGFVFGEFHQLFCQCDNVGCSPTNGVGTGHAIESRGKRRSFGCPSRQTVFNNPQADPFFGKGRSKLYGLVRINTGQADEHQVLHAVKPLGKVIGNKLFYKFTHWLY
jgi:hypothetical protein